MQPNTEQIAALKKRDPVLGEAINRLPPFPDMPVGNFRNPYFHVLARSIIHQQLATNAAATIYGRVRRLGPRGRFPTPSQMLLLSEEALRQAGLSRNKVKAIRDLAIAIQPVVPEKSSAVLDQLGIPAEQRSFSDLSDETWFDALVAAGHIIGKPTPVFPRLELPVQEPA
mgnify:CR=1 FL=1